MTIKDNKVPYVFLAGGEPGDYQEPDGRRIFTLTLLAVLVARKIFAPVTYDGSSAGKNVSREYDIVGEILMPVSALRGRSFNSLDEVKAVADEFKVTASAIVVRAMRLKLIGGDAATTFLDDLRREYERRTKPKMRTPKAINAIRKYTGRELSLRMLDALDAGKLSDREFCRAVCLNRIKPAQIGELRVALR